MATTRQYFDAIAGVPHATAIPEQVKIDGTNFPVWGFAFTINTNEQLSFRWKALNYGSGNVTVTCFWFARTGQTTNTVTWGAALSVLTPGDAQSVLTDAFATENTSSATAPNGTASGLTSSAITVSNLDSLANGDSVEMRIRRTDNSMTGDAVLIGLEISYSDT